MPKINAYSRDNVFNTLGFIDLHISYLNQPVLDTSSPTFQNVNVVDDVVIGGDLFVSGNATISGNTTVIGTDIVEIKDNIVLINSQETNPGVTLNLAGVEVERGTLPNFQSVFEESSDLYKIGEVGSLQAVATREDTPLDKGIIVYNQLLRRLDSVTTIELPITFSDTTASTSSSIGSIKIAGSIAISNTSNSTSSLVGGAFTAAGGIAVAKDAYIGGALDVNGITTLDQTTIDTTDGQLSISGTNAVSIIVNDSSIFRVTSGNITIDSDLGNVSIIGETGVNIDSNSGISIDSAGASNFSTSSGQMTISGIGMVLNSNSGALTLDSNNTTLGIKIANNIAGIPITLGTDTSTIYMNGNVVIKDNSFIINAYPVSTVDSGYFVKRYQTANNSSLGDLLSDIPIESSTFDNGSTAVSVVLNASASAVDNYYNGMWIHIVSGAGSGQVRRIKDYDGTTKIALLYNTADNVPEGLDLLIVPANGDSYDILNKYYIGIYYNESDDEFRFTGIPIENTFLFPTPIDYSSIHVGALIVEGPSIYNGDTVIDQTSTQALLVRKNNNTGDVFKVDTLNGKIVVANPVNTISSKVNVSFEQLDNVSAVSTYSSIESTITNNVSGNLRNDLAFKVQKDTNGLSTFFTLSGGTSGFADFSTNVNAVRILNTTASTSSSIGALLVSGGIAISNTTNSSSSTLGGALTIAGGAAIAQNLYVGGNVTAGSIDAGITTPSITVSNTVNITGIVTISGVKLISNGLERTLSMTFRLSPTATGLVTSFEYTVPGIVTFANVYDIIVSVNGYTNDADPVNIENKTGYATVSTNRAKVKFTSNGVLVHTVQIIARYSV